MISGLGHLPSLGRTGTGVGGGAACFPVAIFSWRESSGGREEIQAKGQFDPTEPRGRPHHFSGAPDRRVRGGHPMWPLSDPHPRAVDRIEGMAAVKYNVNPYVFDNCGCTSPIREVYTHYQMSDSTQKCVVSRYACGHLRIFRPGETHLVGKGHWR